MACQEVLNTVNVKKTKTLNYWELVGLDLQDIQETMRKDTTDTVKITKHIARYSIPLYSGLDPY
jgi:hypothetical protein